MKRFLVLFFVLIWAGSAQGSIKYASPNGSADNSGISPNQAWTLAFALGNSSPLVPGDSLFLTDGIFEGNFISSISGTADNPIVILAQNEGKAIIDVGKQRTSGTGIKINGSHTWFVGIHVTSSSLIRKSDASNGFATIPYESGISVFGDNNKIINCWVYDVVGGGLELWRSGLNLEIYGSVIFNNGSQDVSRGTGHGMYIQHNQPSQPKVIENNFVFQNASQGINIFTTDPANSGIISKRNVSFNTGVIATFDPFLFRPPHNFSIGSQNNLSSDMEVTSNLFYSDLQGGRLDTNDVGNVTLGRTYTPNLDISFNDNILFGGRNQVELQPLEGLSFQRNKLLNVHGNFFAFLGNSSSFPNSTWDSNIYSNVANTAKPFQGLNFSEWKTAFFPFDANSIYSINPAKTREVLITQNKYDPYRFHVSILSFTDSEFIALDFSDFAEFKNVDYEIRDIQNPFDPSQIASGTFGGSSIGFPMNWTKSLQPKGNMPFQAVHTDLTFGTFLLVFDKGENVPVVFPEVKDSVSLYLNTEGKAFLKTEDFLVDQPAEPFTYVSSEGFEFSCTNIGSTPITITSKNLRTGEVRVDQTVVWVFDTIPPYFDAANATYLFDPVVGKITIHLPDFSPTDFHDNCTSWWNITQSRFEVTCADIYQNPEAPVWEFPVVLTSTDPSGNSYSRTVKVIIGNIIESKKVSISSSETFVGQPVTLTLGDELVYSVKSWIRDFQGQTQVFPDQQGKTFVATLPGTYFAVLYHESACGLLVSAQITLEVQEADYIPEVKDSVSLFLNEEGKTVLKPEDFLVVQPSEPFTYSSSKGFDFNCSNLGKNEVTITSKNTRTGEEWTEATNVWVFDTIPPYFDAANATYLFDPVVGKVSISIADFDIVDFKDNCSTNQTISQSRFEVTCSDIYQNPEAPVWEFPVVLTSTDPSGNTYSRTVKAIIGNIIESKKVSITSLDPLTDDGSSTLRLGNELEYQVLQWTRNGQVIPGQSGKEITINSPGQYQAKIQLSTGCPVNSKSFNFESSDLPAEYTNDVNLILDETGKVSLTPVDIFGTNEKIADEVILGQTNFDCTDLGTQKVKVTLNTSLGNDSYTNEFWINVIVKDNLAPVLIIKIPSLAFDLVKGVLELKPEDFVASLTDNCGVTDLYLNKTKITCADYDLPIELILTAKDQSGNITSKLLMVSVSSFESKKISINPSGNFQAYNGEPLEIRLGEEFGFSVESWLKDGVPIVGEKGKAILVNESGTYWARILPNGGCSVLTEKVTVTFSDLPYGEVKEIVELPLNESGKATLKPENVFVSWPPADPNLDIKLSQSEFTCSDIGEKEITITIKNQTGKTWTEKTIVKVQDKLKPVLIPKNFTADFDVTVGTLALKPADFIAELTDNCEVKEVTINKTTATCEDLGKEIPVTIRAIDTSGNVVEAVAILTLNRVETTKISISPAGPIFKYVGQTVELSLGNEFEYIVSGWYKNGVLIPDQKEKKLIVSTTGVYFAKLTSQNSCLLESKEVKVEFTEVPFPVIKEMVLLPLNESGKGTLKPEDVFVSWPPSDPNLEIKLSQSEFTCSDIGEKEIAITIKNQAGQTWEEKTVVKVQDTLKPVLTPKNFNADFDVTLGTLALKPADFIAELTDNCGVKEVTINKTSANCEDLGKEIPVAIRAVDASGNVVEAVAILTLNRIETKKVTISGDAEFCAGEKRVLTLNSEAPFEVIRWRRDGVEIEGQKGKTLEIEQGGNYHAVIRYSGGCLSETDVFVVERNPLPAGEIEEKGNVLTAPAGGFTYQWFRNGELIPGATFRELIVHQMGEYTVELTSGAGCKAKLKPIVLTISGLGNNWVVAPEELRVFPNPASRYLEVEIISDQITSVKSIKIVSMDGKDVTSSVIISKSGSNAFTFDISKLANATYLVYLEGEEQKSFFGRFIKNE